jgi:hypothetical protein
VFYYGDLELLFMYVVRLVKVHDPFYDPETNLHLTFYNQQSPVDFISPAIAKALRSGKLADVVGNIDLNALQGSTFPDTPVSSVQEDILSGETDKVEEPVVENTEVSPVVEEVEPQNTEVPKSIQPLRAPRGTRGNGKSKSR